MSLRGGERGPERREEGALGERKGSDAVGRTEGNGFVLRLKDQLRLGKGQGC